MKSETNNHGTPGHGASGRVAVGESQWTRDDGVDWGTIHAEIQRSLAALDGEVEARVPGVQISSGRTAGHGFFLFSYRRFAPPHPSRIDPVVAGVTFKPLDDRVAIEADISGEESGDILEACETDLVSPATGLVLHHAREVARCLSSAGERIAAALADTGREIS